MLLRTRVSIVKEQDGGKENARADTIPDEGSDEMLKPVEDALRRSDTATALTLARQWAVQALSEGRAPNDAGLEIARVVAAVYRDFITEPAHEFQASAARALPEGVGALVERALKRLTDPVFAWEQKLETVYRERLARELRDLTKSRDVRSAAENLRLLCAAARTEDDALRLARYCGNVLGSCENHPREAEAVIAHLGRDPAAFGLTHELITELDSARRKRLDVIMRSRMETRELEWTRMLTQTVVEMKEVLPPKERMDEPDEAALRDTADLFRAILRIPLWRGQPEKFTDATLLLVEFAPRDLAQAAAQSGVEQRAYWTLGYTAKKAALLAFTELGKSANFTQVYEAWVRERVQSPYLKYFIELMGATHAPVFYGLLVEWFGQKRLESVREEIVDALGNLGNADARRQLLAHLGETLSARVVDPPRARSATRTLTALGKLSRSPRLTPAERADLVRKALKSSPEGQTRLALHAAMQFFSYNPSPLPDDLKQWAAQTLTFALWLPDDTPEWVQGSERQESILGYRHTITESLKKIVPEAPGPFLEAADRHAARYSGAYMAVAEICEKTRLAAALPILEKMLLSALLFDDTDVTKYSRESYWDSTAGQRVALAKDKVVAPLVYAIGTIGGPEALRILGNLEDEARSGRLRLPGVETARHLDVFLKGLRASFGESAAGAGEQEALSEAAVRERIKTLRSSFLFSGAEARRRKIIVAIGELARARPEEAIEALVERLADKDDLVSGAARAALREYTAPRTPGRARGRLFARIVEALGDRDPAIRQQILRLMREIGPACPDLKPLLDRELRMTEKPLVRSEIEALFREGGVGQKPLAEPAPLPGAESQDGKETEPGADAIAGPPRGEASQMDLKRQYILARQEWIRGGKKGPPPEPPEGLKI